MRASPRRPRRGGLASVAAATGLVAVATSLAAVVGVSRSGGAPPALPDIVFVARQPARDTPEFRPGIGPGGRARVVGGRLMLRRANGRVQPFLHGGRFFDVAHPTVSFDGRWVAFAAVTARDSAWRIWIADRDGRRIAPVTHTAPPPLAARGAPLRAGAADAAAPVRADDLDPCWLPDGRLCFASTRFPMQSEAGPPTTNLFLVNRDGAGLIRITDERDGAEFPAVDAETGRIVCARWWTSRVRASDLDRSGITTDTTKALPGERVSLWHAISIRPDGQGARLAGGYPRVRVETMAYQPIVLGDGTLVGVTADDLTLARGGGRLRLAVYPHRFGPPLAFPAAPAQMCAPAALPDGRLLVAYDPAGTGDFGIAVVNADGTGATMLVDRPHSLELDPVPLAPRPLPPVLGPGLGGLPRRVPVADLRELIGTTTTVRFDCLNVFANGPVDFPIPDAPRLARDARIRFYAALARPGAASGDSIVLVREEPVDRSGAIHVDDIPGDVPMFEQLVDAHGHVLRSSSGPAHVPGFNSGRMGAGTQCVGCHVGHSAISVELSYALGKRFNAAPAADVAATSVAAGSAAAAAVDRRTRGATADVAWIARGTRDEALTLRWPFPLAVDSLVIYGIRPDPASATDLTVTRCAVTLLRAGEAVATRAIDRPLSPNGTGLELRGVHADAIEVRPVASTGRVLGVARVGLAEVEAKARIPED